MMVLAGGVIVDALMSPEPHLEQEHAEEQRQNGRGGEVGELPMQMRQDGVLPFQGRNRSWTRPSCKSFANNLQDSERLIFCDKPARLGT